MNKLKAGDKVKFSEAAKILQGLDATGIYTVAKIDRCFVYLYILDTEQGCWYESDFEKVSDNKHKHHAVMIQYANDCTLEIEVKDSIGRWDAIDYPHWLSSNEYRIKPKPERKSFNLEEALAGKRVVTSQGDEVTQLTQFKTLSYPNNVYAVVNGGVMRWYRDGSYDIAYPNSSDRYKLYMQELS